MDEKEKVIEKTEQPKEKDKIDLANEASERMEKATEAQKVENDRLEKLRVEDALGGTTEAGQPKAEKKKLSDEDYAKAYEAGEVDPFKDGKDG